MRLESGFQQTTGMPKLCSQPLRGYKALPPGALRLDLRAPGRNTTVALAAISSLHGDESAPLAADRAAGDSVHQYTFEAEIGQVWRLDRLVSVYTSREVTQPAEAALAHLNRFLPEGARQSPWRPTGAWAERWRASDVQVEGDPPAQQALRFAVYHLISAANPEDERVSVGTGPNRQGL